MALPVWLNNLIAYTLQIAILASAGTLLAYLFRLRVARVALFYWQFLLLICLFLPCLQPWMHPRIIRSVPISQSMTAPTVEVNEITQSEPIKPPKPVLWKYVPHILGGGITLRILWLAIGFLRLGLFRRKSQPFSDERTIIQDMQWRTGIRVTVLLSPAIHSPVTFGLRSPVIILPASFSELSEACKQAVLCHELMHVRRYDWVVILAEEIIRSAFWFHPAIWWILNRIRLSREQAVDHEVVQLIGSKEPYLNSLLEFARTHQRLHTVPAPLFLSERHLVQRVALLLKEVSMSRTRIAFSMTAISALLLATLYFATGWFPLTGKPVFAQNSMQIILPEPLQSKAAVPEQPQIAKLQALPAMASPAILAAAAVPPQQPEVEIKAPLSEPLRIGSKVQESKLIYRVKPEYPAMAKQQRIEGSVMLMVTINEEGEVWEIQVIEGPPLFTDSAVQAVKQWKFSPTLLNGTPVPVITTVTVTYTLWKQDDLAVLMDNSGHITGNLDWLLQTKGTVVLTVLPQTPYNVADDAIQGLLSRGVQRIQVLGDYVLHQSRLYYTGAPDRPDPSSDAGDAIVSAFIKVMKQQVQGKTIRFNYRVFISETGEVVGLQQMGSDAYPEFAETILGAHVTPVLQNGIPVPYARTLTHYNVRPSHLNIP